jgi:hypothetical protein
LLSAVRAAFHTSRAIDSTMPKITHRQIVPVNPAMSCAHRVLS